MAREDEFAGLFATFGMAHLLADGNARPAGGNDWDEARVGPAETKTAAGTATQAASSSLNLPGLCFMTSSPHRKRRSLHH
jgi:hypothetical protein